MHTNLATATWCSGQYVVLLLIGSRFDDALGFDFILNVLRFQRVIRDGVQWRQKNKQKNFAEPF